MIPTDEDIQAVLQLPPVHQYTDEEIGRFLRDLQNEYPNSRLLVVRTVDLIETSCTTGQHCHLIGVIAIIEQLQPPYQDRRYVIRLLGGPTGHESFYVTGQYRFVDWGKAGWSACSGIPGRLNACYVVPNSMDAVWVDFFDACQHGPKHSFPPPLTEDERRGHTEVARIRFLASLRRRATMVADWS